VAACACVHRLCECVCLCVCVCVCMLVCVGQREGMAACARVHRLLVGDFFVFCFRDAWRGSWHTRARALCVCVCERERESECV